MINTIRNFRIALGFTDASDLPVLPEIMSLTDMAMATTTLMTGKRRTAHIIPKI